MTQNWNDPGQPQPGQPGTPAYGQPGAPGYSAPDSQGAASYGSASTYPTSDPAGYGASANQGGYGQGSYPTSDPSQGYGATTPDPAGGITASYGPAGGYDPTAAPSPYGSADQATPSYSAGTGGYDQASPYGTGAQTGPDSFSQGSGGYGDTSGYGQPSYNTGGYTAPDTSAASYGSGQSTGGYTAPDTGAASYGSAGQGSGGYGDASGYGQPSYSTDQPATSSYNAGGYTAPDTSAASYGSAGQGSGGYGDTSGYGQPSYNTDQPATSSYNAGGYTAPDTSAASYGSGQSTGGYTAPDTGAASYGSAGQGNAYGDTSSYGQPSYNTDQPATSSYNTGGYTAPDTSAASYGSAGQGYAAGSSGYGATDSAAGYGAAGSYGASDSGYGGQSSYGSSNESSGYEVSGGYGSTGGYGQSQPGGYGSTGGYGTAEAYQDPSAAAGYGTPYTSQAMTPYGYDSGYVSPAAPLASWGQRALGWLVDWFAPSLVAWILSGVFSWFIDSSAVGLLFSLVWMGFVVWNSGYQAGTTGYSLGRKIAKIKLISEETNQPLGAGQAILRVVVQWGMGLFTCGLLGLISWLFPLWDQKRQTLADKMVKSVVVEDSGMPPSQY